MGKILRYLFYWIIIKPIVYICLGLNVHNAENLPKSGPAIIISNHNSHLDTLVLMSLFPTHLMLKISPVAAADYFLKNKFVAWFVLNVLKIIPISRKVSKESNVEFFEKVEAHLKNNGIIILYPEGSRGKPEQMEKLKTGIFHIAKQNSDVPVIPVFMHGLGLALPKNEVLFVPAICKVWVAEAVKFQDNRDEYMDNLNRIFTLLSHKVDERDDCSSVEKTTD